MGAPAADPSAALRAGGGRYKGAKNARGRREPGPYELGIAQACCVMAWRLGAGGLH